MDNDDIIFPSTVPFVLLHAACFAAIWYGVNWTAGLLCAVLYFVRMFAIGAGYHRYFSHRAYATTRTFQFILAFFAQSTAQKSVLWWAAKHRQHHLYSDTERDVHSPRHTGFVYSHVGWIFSRAHDLADLTKINDFARFPELRWLHAYELLPPAALAGLCFAIDGMPGVIVGFAWSTVLVYHATFCINSLAHLKGRRRYITGDDSRNNWILALVTMGEGWHNNHHAYPSSARQGFRWWEVDLTYYLLWLLSKAGVVWALRNPPEKVLCNNYRLGAKVIEKVAAELVVRRDLEKIAAALTTCLLREELADLKLRIAGARHGLTIAFAGIRLPSLPTRDQLLNDANCLLWRNRPHAASIEEIANRAYELLLAGVGSRLMAHATAGS